MKKSVFLSKPKSLQWLISFSMPWHDISSLNSSLSEELRAAADGWYRGVILDMQTDDNRKVGFIVTLYYINKSEQTECFAYLNETAYYTEMAHNLKPAVMQAPYKHALIRRGTEILGGGLSSFQQSSVGLSSRFPAWFSCSCSLLPALINTSARFIPAACSSSSSL